MINKHRKKIKKMEHEGKKIELIVSTVQGF